MDTFIVGTGAGLVIIGAITRKLAPMVVGLGFLLTRAYLQYKEGKVSTDTPTATGTASNYTAGTAEHDKLVAAQDAWYKLHPEGPPFVNDDGSYNLAPGIAL